MIITQLSIKVVDEPGQLGRVSDLLGDEGINIRALTAAVHGDDSRFHIVVDDPTKARGVLEDRGFEVAEHPVVAVEAPDHPGGLNAILRPLKREGVNITFLYPVIGRFEGNAILIVGADRIDDAVAALQKNYIRILE